MTGLSKGALYALHAALDLTRAGEGEPVTATEVAARYGIPPAVLAKVFQQLVRAGLVAGIRGSRGGYRLARSASRITVLDVLDVFEPRHALRTTPREGRLRSLFDEVDELVRCTFASISLETLAGRRRPEEPERRQ
jgi:Rrf2 family protein